MLRGHRYGQVLVAQSIAIGDDKLVFGHSRLELEQLHVVLTVICLASSVGIFLVLLMLLVDFVVFFFVVFSYFSYEIILRVLNVVLELFVCWLSHGSRRPSLAPELALVLQLGRLSCVLAAGGRTCW